MRQRAGPTKRQIECTIELGPYPNGTAQCYVLWRALLPKGKKHKRLMSVVQRITRPGQYSDRIHNPIVFQKIVRLSNSQESENDEKRCYRAAQRALFLLIRQELEKLTRPMLRVGIEGPLESVEPGYGTETLGLWRRAAMHKVGDYLGHWLAWVKTGEFEYTATYQANNGCEMTIKVLRRFDPNGNYHGWGYDVYRVNGTLADCEIDGKCHDTAAEMQHVIEENFKGFRTLE